ncbi:MAG: diguanylate cyclase [Gemmatimonadaceae bacterium]|nr:diguanylate cyclase [Gemmatimonadaceae bacterium]
MTRSGDRNEDSPSRAADELAHLHLQVEGARDELARLRREIALANERAGVRAADLVEANEQLVLATMQAHADVDESTRAHHLAAQAATLDALTSLPNRRLMLDRLGQSIATAKRHQSRLAVLFVDLDDFKQVNDALGHAGGDRVLQLTAEALAASVRGADTVSRHGGDEFLILLSEVNSAADAEAVAEKVIAAVSVAQRVGDVAVQVTASVGISLYPDDGIDATALIGHADTAMYQAKRRAPGSHALFSALPPDDRQPPSADATSTPRPFDPTATPRTTSERRHADLQEANEQLVLAAISAQEKQADAEGALKRQTEFLARVAHELCSPLSPIRHATALLGMSPSDTKLLYRATAIIDRQVTYITRLVSDLLDMAHLGSGALGLESRDVDLSEIIDASSDNWRPAIDARHQFLVVRRPGFPLHMRGDPVRLAQILDNLLDNASRYTPEGGTIHLSVQVRGDTVTLSLSDSGIGISAETLPTVFDLFSQTSGSDSNGNAGLGIGLTVVRDLVTAHDGTVRVSSAGRGRGTEVVVTFPLTREVVDEAPPTSDGAGPWRR